MTSRRRFLAIAASSLAASSFVASSFAGPSTQAAVPAGMPNETPVSVWKGTALGAVASLSLVHPDRALARAAIERCVSEIDRLESIFSLYRDASAVSRLNAAGQLEAPPAELLELMSFAMALARASDGAFDPTVQPLYRLYTGHFAAHPSASQGPSRREVEKVLRSIGHQAVELATDRIRFHRPGMAITLNGVAQGFVSDRIAALLRREGFDNVLVDLGEAVALGHRADGGPWRAGIADPSDPQRSLFELALGDAAGEQRALASSGGYGTRFGPATHLHHLLDPRSGTSADHHAMVSVVAPRATLADGLSTTLSILTPPKAEALLASYPTARAWFVDFEGRVRTPGTA